MATNIFIVVPAFGNTITSTTFLTTHYLQQTLASKGVGGSITTLSFPDIAELRSMFATIFHDTMKATHLLFIDADMGFGPDLVMDMLLLDEPVVGTIYRQRKEQVSWAGSGSGEPMAERRGNFMEVEGVGMGCTLIKREVFSIMLEKMPQLIDTRIGLHPAGDTLKLAGCNRLFRCFEKMDIPERGVISEDLSFCIRWRQCGGRVWASIGHRISHVGMYDYQGRYLDQFENPTPATQAAIEAAQAQQQTQVPIPPLPPTNGTPIGEVPAPAELPATPVPPEQQVTLDAAAA